jgi:hypothetical protein
MKVLHVLILHSVLIVPENSKDCLMFLEEKTILITKMEDKLSFSGICKKFKIIRPKLNIPIYTQVTADHPRELKSTSTQTDLELPHPHSSRQAIPMTQIPRLLPRRQLKLRPINKATSKDRSLQSHKAGNRPPLVTTSKRSSNHLKGGSKEN